MLVFFQQSIIFSISIQFQYGEHENTGKSPNPTFYKELISIKQIRRNNIFPNYFACEQIE